MRGPLIWGKKIDGRYVLEGQSSYVWFDPPFRLVGPTDLISNRVSICGKLCVWVSPLIPLTITYGMDGIGSNENGISKL